MKQSLILLCLGLAVSAIRPKETKTTLEDIDNDYTTINKRTKLTPPPLPRIPAKSPTQFGFVPAKTAVDYIQQEPKPNYSAKYQVKGAKQVQFYQESPQYQQVGVVPYHVGVSAPQAGVSDQQAGVSDQQVGVSPYQVGAASQEGESQQYAGAGGHLQYNTIQYSGPTYIGPEANTAVPQVYYVPQAQDNYENSQYVTDNNIGQAGQQYVYLQQYQAPTSAVQAVFDPTQGGVQYVMYLPSYSPSTSVNQLQNYENVYSPSSSSYQPTSSQKSQYYQAPNSQKEESSSQGKTQYTKANYVFKREPKSLLDSYVPSNVQLQYYRSQQKAINGGNGKNGPRFTYSPSYSS